MSEKKPTPIFVETNIKFCPVCGKRAYSKEGVHPQCAMARAGVKKKPLVPAADGNLPVESTDDPAVDLLVDTTMEMGVDELPEHPADDESDAIASL